ncbi:MAG TPA: tRNA preQ1(34) S-adenosylmethionine ribosyltransferase-isomerase QueA, partial [Thermomicrobiales bacterium]|nr:tRNA preQ1(34) S-adenosylmethionine ribosyltransferase-isomerase QueA [Thermomicrobiales bacterium]
AEFDYFLPPDLIAQTPPVERDGGKLLVVDRAHAALADAEITDLPSFLRPNDLLVINNTRVLPARLHGRRHTGGGMELLLLTRREPGIWEGLARPARVCKPGTSFEVISRDGKHFSIVTVLENLREGRVVVQVDPTLDDNLDAFGEVPLPPYIKSAVQDPERYQTIFGSVPGSAAAPTAGLHLSERLLAELTALGVGRAEVTLQIGLDTFRPVTVERVVDHHMHSEWCSVPAETATAIAATKVSGGRIVAVGTTSARTLESWATAGSPDADWSAWTSIFITPGYQWQTLDAMLTNFHLPKSTLLMMITSFAGFDLTRQSYLHAITNRYRFFSFGDAMLIV